MLTAYLVLDVEPVDVLIARALTGHFVYLMGSVHSSHSLRMETTGHGSHFLLPGWIFDACNDHHGTTALTPGCNVDTEDMLEPLCPGHNAMTLCTRLVNAFIGHLDLSAYVPFGQRYLLQLQSIRGLIGTQGCNPGAVGRTRPPEY